MLEATSTSSSTHDSEKKRLHDEVELLTKQLKEISGEVERLRQANIIFESKAREFQQDRTDMQSRLKYIYKERDEFEQQLIQARHDIEMKDLFIKQLTYSDPSKELNGQQEIQTIAQEKEKLLVELQQMKSLEKEAQRKQETEAVYYQSCLNELNVKIRDLEERLRIAYNEKSEVETAKHSIEDKLNHLLTMQASQIIPETVQEQISQNGVNQSNNIQQPVNNGYDPVEIDALRNSVVAMQSDYSRATDRIREVEIMLQEKEFVIGQLERQLANEESRCQSMRDEIENLKNIGTVSS